MEIMMHLFLAGCVMWALAVAPAMAVTMERLPDEEGDLRASWIAADEWLTAEPTFRIGEETEEPSARGWVGASDKGVHVRVMVRDGFHVNTREGGAIWDGDALQIGVDALAAGVGMRERSDAFVGPTVSAIAFALTDKGPQAWAHFHGREGGAENRPDLAPRMARDDAAGTTTYDLLFPWADYGLQAGVAGAVGLTVQVNDTDEEGGQKRIYFGQGAGGMPRPGMFRKIVLERPAGKLAGVSFTRTSLWREGDAFEAIVGSYGQAAGEVHVQIGNGIEGIMELPRPVAGRLDGRWVVRGAVPKLPDQPLSVRVWVTSESKTVASETAQIDAPGRAVADLDAKLQAIGAACRSDVVAMHFASVRALFATEWQKATLYTRTNPEMASEVVKYAREMLGYLKDEGQFAEDKYLNGERGMVMAFRGDDRNLDFYHLSLPQGFERGREYPAIVYLHGSGNPHPLNSITGAFAPVGKDNKQKHEPFVRIAPWARGNYGYRDISESDVLRSIAEAKRFAKVDDDRVYLMGHSLGGGGTWAMSLRHPDVWAASAVLSGVTWFLPTGQGYGVNATALPMLIWHGDKDGAANVSEAYAMQKELEAAGAHPEMRIIPGQGHDFLPDAHAEVVNWMLAHRRERPAKFAYKTPPSGKRGVWGVNMRLGRGATGAFTCSVEGSEVRIESQDVKRFAVTLGEDGLGLSGEAKVFLNGELKYTGPATEVNVEAE